jgi:serine/threonine-protein kinase RsbW
VNPAGARQPRVTAAPESSDVLRLPHSASAVGVARRRIRHELAALGVDRALLDDIEVVVSELLSNAVRHARPIAGGALLVAWRLSGNAVTVKVTDGGSPGSIELRGTGVLAETGRGLQIVDRLVSDWGVVDHAGGSRTVWARLGPAGVTAGVTVDGTGLHLLA